jgi:putative transposase
MKNKLRRYYGRGDLHFVTFSCFERRAFLGSLTAKTVFVETLNEVRERYQFGLVGYVLMPEHVHLLIGEPFVGDLSKVLQVLKQRVSREIRSPRRAELESMPEASLPQGWSELSRFWDRRFYDFNVYSLGKLNEKLNYMHANPVVRGLVKHPREWPWSSWSFYECGEVGLMEMDVVDAERIKRKTHPLKSAKGAAPALGG